MSLEKSLGKTIESPVGLAVAVGLGLLVLYVGYRAVKGAASAAVNAGAGLVTGNNAITQNATDWGGAPETAYQGAGVAGTLGAATNAASGGALASLGNWIGGKVYDLLNPTSSSSGGSTSTSSTPAAGGAPSSSGGSASTDINFGIDSGGW